ncbi:sugar transferase [Caldicellulosiruptoraceae bacterium PP1]
MIYRRNALLLDVFSVMLAYLLGITLKFKSSFNLPLEYCSTLLVILFLDIFYLYIKGLYHNDFNTILKDLRYYIEAFAFSISIYLLISFFLKISGFSRLLMIYIIFFGLLFQIIGKSMLLLFQKYEYKKGNNLSNLLIIGDVNLISNSLLQKLNNYELGYKVIGYVSNDIDNNAYFSYLGNIKNINEILENEKIKAVIITQKKHIKPILNYCINNYIKILSLESFVGYGYPFDVDIIGDAVLFKIKDIFTNTPGGRFKRIVDFSISFIALLITSPLFLLISILIKLDSKGPIFFVQDRVGINGETFKCIKFRTMVINAEEILMKWFEENPEIKEEYEKSHKLKDDPRITRMGKLLRLTSLDELPQLINVLKGEMSIVGPRPYMVREIPDCEGYEGLLWRVHPGITGLWQISGRANTDFSHRLKMDMQYVLNWSFWLDIVILFKTIPAVLKRDGAY